MLGHGAHEDNHGLAQVVIRFVLRGLVQEVLKHGQQFVDGLLDYILTRLVFVKTDAFLTEIKTTVLD